MSEENLGCREPGDAVDLGEASPVLCSNLLRSVGRVRRELGLVRSALSVGSIRAGCIASIELMQAGRPYYLSPEMGWFLTHDMLIFSGLLGAPFVIVLLNWKKIERVR